MNAFMPDFDFHTTSEPIPRQWEGIAEIDEALRADRLLEYRWKKSWADPWSRRLTIAISGLFALFGAFVIYWDVVRG